VYTHACVRDNTSDLWRFKVKVTHMCAFAWTVSLLSLSLILSLSVFLAVCIQQGLEGEGNNRGGRHMKAKQLRTARGSAA